MHHTHLHKWPERNYDTDRSQHPLCYDGTQMLLQNKQSLFHIKFLMNIIDKNKSKEDKILFLNEVKDIVKYNQQRFLDFGKDYRFELAKVINFLLNTSKSLI